MSTATMSNETLTHPTTPSMLNTPVLPQTITPTPIQSQPKLTFTNNRYRLRCTAH